MRNILLKDGMLLLIGTVFNTVSMLLLQVFLARYLSLESYGTVITSFNLINLLALTVSLGFADYLLSFYGKYGRNIYKLIRVWMKNFPLLIGLQLLILVMIYFGGIFNKELSIFILLISPNIILQGMLPLIASIYQVQGNFLKFIVVNFSIYFVRLISIIALFIDSNKLYGYGICLSILSLILLIYFNKCLRDFCNESEEILIKDKHSQVNVNLKDILKKIKPYAFLGFCFYGYYQSNILLINIYLSEEMVAFYNSAFIIIGLAFVLPNLIVGQLFNSKVHQWDNNNFIKVKELFFVGTKNMLLIGLFVALILFVFGKYIVLILFGQMYSYSSEILSWLLILIPFRYMQAMGNSIMNTENNIVTKSKLYFIVSVFSIVLNIALIPKLGMSGVIITAIITEVLLLLLTLYFTSKYINKRLMN